MDVKNVRVFQPEQEHGTGTDESKQYALIILPQDRY
jgi:hypothetical protein